MSNFFAGSLIRGNARRAGEQGANMSGYLLITFSVTYIKGGREKTCGALGADKTTGEN